MAAILRLPPAGRRSLSGVSHFASLKSTLSQRYKAQLHSLGIYFYNSRNVNPRPDAPSNLTSIMPKYAFTTIESTIDKRIVGCHSIRSYLVGTLLRNN